MKTQILTSLLVAFCLFSCKQDQKPADVESKKEEVSNVFKVTLDIKVAKDDSFHLYFNEDGGTEFTEENSIWTEVKGSQDSQTVSFTLPENTKPAQLRIDLGVNKDQEPLVIKNFKMDYQGKSFEAPGAEFFKYFRPNELNTTIDPATGTITAVKKEGQPYFGPQFYPMEDLSAKIEAL